MFSGTIKISNIDDYLQPGKECIKPLQVGKVLDDNHDSISLKGE